MGLGRKLYNQNIKAMIITVLVTILAGVLFGHIYSRMTRQPVNFVGEDTKVIVVRDESVVFVSSPISRVDALDVLMSIKMNRAAFNIGGVNYSISEDNPPESESGGYRIIKLIPVFDVSGYYNSMLLFVIFTFIISFLLSGIIVQRFFSKSVISPVKNLTKTAINLRDGELGAPVAYEGDGEISELCCAIEDLRVRLKESVYLKEKYDKNRNFLISSISHDLRTPVTAIRGYAEGVLSGVADTTEKRERYLNAAIDKTVLINSMIEDLLLYSKLDLNQIPFDLERINIYKFMTDCVSENELSFQGEGKSLELICEICGEAYVLIDANRFKRVMQNILDNAGRHISSDTGRVAVILRESAACVIIEVRDNGPGIRGEDLPYIFDRFYKAEASRSNEGSSGLGLAIAKQIVEGIGGRIWAISKGGASIIISLKKD